jgi:hypothetical protein
MKFNKSILGAAVLALSVSGNAVADEVYLDLSSFFAQFGAANPNDTDFTTDPTNIWSTNANDFQPVSTYYDGGDGTIDLFDTVTDEGSQVFVYDDFGLNPSSETDYTWNITMDYMLEGVVLNTGDEDSADFDAANDAYIGGFVAGWLTFTLNGMDNSFNPLFSQEIAAFDYVGVSNITLQSEVPTLSTEIAFDLNFVATDMAAGVFINSDANDLDMSVAVFDGEEATDTMLAVKVGLDELSKDPTETGQGTGIYTRTVDTNSPDYEFTSVPEPTSLGFLGLALLSLGALRRRK